MNRGAVLVLISVILVVGCTHRVPTATLELIDTSLSITSQGEKDVLEAAKNQISHMERGDTLILIPITGNAENDAGGRILRLQAPTRREPYDSDLRRFRDTAERAFSTWAARQAADDAETDILGSLDAARQELAAIPKGSARRMIVLSDFLEDDDQYRFVTDHSLASASAARTLASQIRSAHSFAVKNASVCLGRLESEQYNNLPVSRREAIRAFWGSYLQQNGQSPAITFDGVGMLAGVEAACPAIPERKR